MTNKETVTLQEALVDVAMSDLTRLVKSTNPDFPLVVTIEDLEALSKVTGRPIDQTVRDAMSLVGEPHDSLDWQVRRH